MDTGECLFTHLFWAKLGLINPKTNQKRQRKHVFVIVNVQVRIYRKKTKNKQKSGKNEHESRTSQKVKLEIKLSFEKSKEIPRVKDLHDSSFSGKFEEMSETVPTLLMTYSL